jgi:hypothetical protein
LRPIAADVFKRRRLPDRLDDAYRAFLEIVPPLERAKAALTESVPGTRLPGRPLGETLHEFEEGLREVAGGMDAWRAPEVDEAWRAAATGLDAAKALAERVRVHAPEPAGFEALIGLIGELLVPLEAFPAAEARFRELRR